MTSVTATIGEDTVTGDVHEMDIWRESLGVGRWQLILNNMANKWGDDFHANDVVIFDIDDVELLRGYVDDVQPYLDPQGVYTNLIKVVGRDYGRDLARLYLTASYSDKKGDDAIDDLLAKAESEILYTSPHTAPVINMARNRTYLIDWLQDIGKRLNYDAYVSAGKTLNFFAVGAAAKHTAVDLKSITAAMTNNILKLLKGEELGFSIANYIELSAGPLQDHYTDGNAVDWDAGTSTTVVNEPIKTGAVVANTPTSTVFKTDLTIAIDDYYNGLTIEFTSGTLDGERKIISNYVGVTKQITVQSAFSEAPSVDDTFMIHGCWVGISSIKFYCTVSTLPSMTLDFSGTGKYSHAGLDLSSPAEMSFYVRHKCVAATASVRPRLEDGNGNIIEFKRMGKYVIGIAQKGKTEIQAHNKWHKIQIPIGESEDNIIKNNETNNKWYYWTKIDEFDWSNVKKIEFISAGATGGYGNFWIDNLCIPSIEVISIGEDATSIVAYDKAMFFDQRNDIKSQIELDALMISELAKRKDPLQKIHITASGQTSSRYAGVSLDVQAPGHGIADLTKYRIFKLHHQVRKDPITKGFDFITEYDLIKHTINPTQVVDPLRVSLADDPVGTLIDILSLTRRRARSAETTARQEFGDTHPASTVFFSGSGVAFPVDPEDGFTFRLTADITSTHLAGYYQYDEATTSWIRQPALFRRATNPTFGQLEGDVNQNTTDGMNYKWTGSAWLRTTTRHTEGTTLPSSGMINGDTFYHETQKKTYFYDGTDWQPRGTPSHDGLIDVSGADHHTVFTTTQHANVEHLASMLNQAIQPYNSNITFARKSGQEDDGITYTAGEVKFQDGTARTITPAGELLDLDIGDNYIYFKTDSASLFATINHADAISSGRGLLAIIIVVTKSDTDQPCAIQPFYAKGLNITADAMSVIVLSAITSYLGNVEIANGFILLGDSGIIVDEGDVIIDAGGIKVYGPDNLRIYDVNSVLRGSIFGVTTGCMSIYTPGWLLINTSVDGTKFNAGPLFPGTNLLQSLGTATTRWRYFVPITTLALRPDPSADTVGLLWQTRAGSGQKTYTWQCVQKSDNNYGWMQTGISA